MVDLLRYLRDRGVIVQEQGRWTLARAVPDLQRELPESVRGMIQRKVDQLTPARPPPADGGERAGAAVRFGGGGPAPGQGAADVEERLDVLERVHFMVRLVREQTFPDRTLTLRYGFVHVLYQNALYAALQPTRKAAWSAAAARVLLGHYGEKSAGLAAELAMLFEAARDHERAADHYLVAAENAARVFAHHEAVTLARSGLALLQTLPDTPERGRRELPLLVTLGVQVQVAQGYAVPEAERTVRSRPHPVRADAGIRQTLPRALGTLDVLLRPPRPPEGAGVGRVNSSAGQECPGLRSAPPRSRRRWRSRPSAWAIPAATTEHMEQAVALYDPKRHRPLTDLYGQDPAVVCLAFRGGGPLAARLSGAGGASAAGRQSRSAANCDSPVRWRWQYISPPCFSSAAARGRRSRKTPRQSTAIATEHGLTFWLAGGLIMRGWFLVEQERLGRRHRPAADGLAAWTATNGAAHRTYHLTVLAEALGRRERPKKPSA